MTDTKTTEDGAHEVDNGSKQSVVDTGITYF